MACISPHAHPPIELSNNNLRSGTLIRAIPDVSKWHKKWKQLQGKDVWLGNNSDGFE